MFDRCAKVGEGAFGAFLMLGDPDLETSAMLLDALVEGGADMVELGIPFSDPVADGPVIQAAALRALNAGVRTQQCLDLITVGACHVRLQLSMLLLPRTTRANFCAMKLSSFVALEQLKRPNEAPPWRETVASNPLAARSIASSQLARRRDPESRTRGCASLV
jgi:hypothetical protein